MKLNYQDYDLLIKNYAAQVGDFSKDTSLSYQYLRDLCNRLIEVSNEYQINFPKEAKRFSDGE